MTQAILYSPRLSHEVQNNIFGFSQPESMRCNVWEYHRSHSVLMLEISNKDYSSVYELTFIMVAYIAAPSHWLGANFKLLSLVEALQFVQDINVFSNRLETKSPEFIQSLLDSVCRVYSVVPNDKPNVKITICAADAQLRRK